MNPRTLHDLGFGLSVSYLPGAGRTAFEQEHDTMNPGRKDGFYWRAFVTFYVIFSFVVIAASGLVLFLSPPGRVANWSQWSFGALLKSDWQAVHTVFALLFLAAAAFHIYFNWRVILNYIRLKVGEGLHRGRVSWPWPPPSA